MPVRSFMDGEGTMGPPGPRGRDGATGPPGQNGPAGVTGPVGVTGPAGVMGPPGAGGSAPAGGPQYAIQFNGGAGALQGDTNLKFTPGTTPALDMSGDSTFTGATTLIAQNQDNI